MVPAAAYTALPILHRLCRAAYTGGMTTPPSETVYSPVAPAGTLIVGATPLGNRGDATPRLRAALATADIVAAEDTRRTHQLARDLGVTITGKVLSHYDHNERDRAPQLIDFLQQGLTVLVVSDAGMPTVSDPGYRVVSLAVAEGIPVTCLPGASAPLTALAISGIGADRFAFDGFAPRKPGPQRAWWESLKNEPRTVIFFESPHRLADTLAVGAEVLGERQAAVCRELTKTYEECRRGTLAELADWAAEGVRGEITVVVAPGSPEDDDTSDATLIRQVEELVSDGIRLNDACRAVAKSHGRRKRELYQAVVAARGEL